MTKIKLCFVFLSFILIAQPKSEAQLNGEYTYSISSTFGTSPFTVGDFAADDLISNFDLSFAGSNPMVLAPLTSVHNPKNGSFTIQGTATFEYYVSDNNYGNFGPEYFNPNLEGDSWTLTDPPIKVSGKTYSDRRTKKSLLDMSGTITLKGTYTPVNQSESTIKKGSLTFKASKLDCNRLYLDTNGEGDPAIRITGSASLANKQIKKFDVSNATISTLWWGGEGYYNLHESFSGDEGFYLDLNVSSTSSTISGTAKAYYKYNGVDLNPNDSYDYTATIQYPDPEVPAKEFTYSVKGTRKNGIATLNLTGLGVIKGLKATIHINESTEEIVQNGKNSITLYGQTITY